MVFDPLSKQRNPLTYPISISPYVPYDKNQDDESSNENEPKSVDLCKL
jgi:hypothetical protein